MYIDRLEANRNIKQTCSGSTMGTRFSAAFYAESSVQIDQVDKALQEAVDRVDAQMSTWKQASDLMNLNAAPVGQWIDVPIELAFVLRRALNISIRSAGAFNVCVGDLVNAWGFGANMDEPDVSAISSLLRDGRESGCDGFEVSEREGQARRIADVAIDLSGIAKGFGVDQLAGVLEQFGIQNYLVSIDGEMRALGAHSDGTPWIAAIESPLAASRSIHKRIEVRDVAVATSGNYRHFFKVGNHLISHTMDPHRARPVENKLVSVTVIANSCWEADAWATALWVLGVEKGSTQAKEAGLCVLFLENINGELVETSVGAF